MDEQHDEMIELLRDAVADCGMSLSELARRSGVSRVQLSYFVHRHRIPTLTNAARIAAALKLELRPVGTSERVGEAQSIPNASHRSPGQHATYTIG